MKAAIFLDVNNLIMNGGWGMRYDVIRELVAAQGATVLRANAYTSVDEDAEREYDVRRKREAYRDAARKAGFHLSLKSVKKYTQSDRSVVTKADSDLDMAVDALLQTEQLDYVLLGTGDGDFVKLVRALQSRGKRVDLLAFSNVSGELRREVDYFFNGFLVPGLLPPPKEDPNVRTGFLHAVHEDKGYGFLTMYTGLGPTDYRDDVFVHITDVRDADGQPLTNQQFAMLKTRGVPLEFDIAETPDNRVKAVNVSEMPMD